MAVTHTPIELIDKHRRDVEAAIEHETAARDASMNDVAAHNLEIDRLQKLGQQFADALQSIRNRP